MTRATVAALALVGALVAGCREEPTIVIKFEPNDLAGGKAADMSVRKPVDLAAVSAPDLGAAKQSTTKSGKSAAQCKVAADCVVEPLECCDCANGGKQHAIPKKTAAATKAARVKKCKSTICTMMLSTDPSCGEHADCVDGACVMIKKK